ncbi:MAG: ThuA domain-containing protein [Anaerolineaceae bacterium]|nr:ThuA domain-containing protein [Anaerolineaceae bacterium]MCY4009120.1 ThuA domain-containing protein [Anaerolineaceae bacterium]
MTANSPLRVTVWNENRHEQDPDHVCRQIYPEGMHGALAEHLSAQQSIEARTATLDEPEHGLSEAVLAETDVLTWWGHMAHEEVAEEVVDRVQRRVLDGMGLIVLHSAHLSKVFLRLLGTSGILRWRDVGERERLWVIEPGHPIVRGVGECIDLPQTEMYGERFDIPKPEAILFISHFEGGEVFRSGCTWQRGRGRIFYFRPGHETFPIYRNEQVLRVITNAVRWAAPVNPGRDEVRQIS